jgi:putative membrane protein
MSSAEGPLNPLSQRSSNELAADRTTMAITRTIMAADRSLMAWVRTGLSMISFGFTLYKVLQGFQSSGGAAAMSHSPRTVGLFLTGLGTAAIVMGTIEYFARLREARSRIPLPTWRPSFIIAVIMSGAGLFLFLGIIARSL